MSLQFGFSSKDIIKEGKVTQSEIDVFKKWLANRSDVPNYTEEQIINFYLACDKVEEVTKSTMLAYNALRNSIPQIFTKREMEHPSLQTSAQMVNYSIFPKRTADGSAVIYTKLVDSNYYDFDFADYVKIVFMLLDAAIYDYPPTSFIWVADISVIGLMHLTRLKLGLIQKGSQYLQTALPVKLGNIHLINSTYMVFKTLAIIKPFLSEKVAKMVVCHSKEDTANFHNVVSRDCLPLELGGELPSVEIIHKQTLAKLKDIQSHFDEEERQREPFKKLLKKGHSLI